MSQTQQYPPIAPNHSAVMPVQNGVPPAYQPSPYGPVPVVPPQRGSGFWVGITAAIATGVILALLAGFFIGRGTRLSNSQAQDKINQQSLSDRITQQRALDGQARQDAASKER